MDSLVESITRIQLLLREAGVESAVIGAVALAVWGEPRFTKDVDLKIALTRDDADSLLAALPPDYQPLGAPREMLERAGMLFVHDNRGIRIDLLLSEVGFDDVAISRAVDIELAQGHVARVCTAEDLVVYKMISTRERDHIDVQSIIRRRGTKLDATYICKWLREFEEALADSTLVETFDRWMSRGC